MEILNKLKIFLKDHNKIIILISSYFIIILIFIISLILIYRFNNKKIKSFENENKLLSQEEIVEENNIEEIDKYYVDIKGAINNPGVYLIDANKRVNDVIKLAGGLTKEANTRYINMSKKIEDEMVIIIYTNKEIEDLKLKEEEEFSCICEEVVNDSCIEEISEETEEINENNLININEASLEELMTLVGIGEVKAQAIIDYRSSIGIFKNIEELMEVNGISESTYSKIKDFITL